MAIEKRSLIAILNKVSNIKNNSSTIFLYYVIYPHYK